ncbi:hypothetical protein [Commensalibacter papalotli (ex Botero et al. 2024)]|uniref:RXYLT1 C-terminal domain-containing protein n=1 Tax=Commensalibacter papalotli (ex Botero et al. 2024) TaxID=2972766 RepID=A0ABN8WIX1_9PROT|nr:hypothetical protein [Commensalibacter papalotli (ex Botero et al. 2024)]CAI3957711.1 unnamed protein product [Commensalibacter papalotli (ex Botero et al. 2024)]CAI3957837.1 unnamed protein product [Commensalibacter papalotli (ex Botero et al. 2024)]
MPIITHFGTVLCLSEHGNIEQKKIEDCNEFNIIRHYFKKDKIFFLNIGSFDYQITKQGLYNLSQNNLFLSSSNDLTTVTCDREKALDWENYYIIPDENYETELSKFFTNRALKEYQFCYTSNVLATLDNLKKIFPNSEYLKRKNNLITRSNIFNTENKVIINCNLHHMFETEWLQEIIPFLDKYEHLEINNASTIKNKNLIIIDSLINEQKLDFYKTLYYNNNNILLVHLSDEAFKDEYRCYEYCNTVWRNLWNPILASYKNVNFFPLGYKAGFKRDINNIKTKHKKYTWFFAGDIKKTNRQIMYDNMKNIDGGYYHLTSYFNSVDALGVKEYREYMENSIFIPCPAGFVHLDSFRIYESLEAGCIPIVENGRGLNCFTPYLGKNPIPFIDNWNNVHKLIKNIIDEGKVEQLMQECSEWWNNYKINISNKIKEDFNNINITNINGSGFCDLDITKFIE